MPSSFEFSAQIATVSKQKRDKKKVFGGAQYSIFDAENNRVKIHRLNKVFREIDTEVQVYDFNRMRLLVSDPDKSMCMNLPLQDLSPVSMVPREHDNLNIADALASVWQTKTSYLGQMDIESRSTQNELFNVESLHVFHNNFSLLHMEQDYYHEGGAHNSESLYLFRQAEDSATYERYWQLAGVVTHFKSGGKPSYVADLGTSFKTIDAKLLQSHNSEYEMKFF